jgi:hypothetical protein
MELTSLIHNRFEDPEPKIDQPRKSRMFFLKITRHFSGLSLLAGMEGKTFFLFEFTI